MVYHTVNIIVMISLQMRILPDLWGEEEREEVGMGGVVLPGLASFLFHFLRN